jgi:hypothetical protein
MKPPPAPTPQSTSAGAKRRTAKPLLPFHALIAYADFPAVRRAMATIDDAMRSLPRRFDFTPMLWRFDQLTVPKWRETALGDAMTANVVVLATSDPGNLPPEMEQWVNTFFARRRGVCTTIVALLGDHDAWTISIEPPPRRSAPSSKARRAVKAPAALAAG